MKVSALGVPSLSDVPCIGTVSGGLKGRDASAPSLPGPASDPAVPAEDFVATRRAFHAAAVPLARS